MAITLPRLQTGVPITGGPQGGPSPTFVVWWNRVCTELEAALDALGITDENIAGVQTQNRIVSDAPFALISPDANFPQARVLTAGPGISLIVGTDGILVIALDKT